jgi:hypothetical protein
MKIAKGDTVYLPDGTKCEYGHKLYHNKHVVYMLSRLHEDAEADLYSHPIIVEEIFPDPPIAEKHKEVASLDKVISDKQTRLLKLQEELRKTEYFRNEQARYIARNEALQHVIDFLEGRIRYFVTITPGGQHDLLSFQETMEFSGAGFMNERGMKLLTLFGNVKGELQWGVNSYKDGSGLELTVHPFRELEAARTFMVDSLLKAVDRDLRQLQIVSLIRHQQNVEKVNARYGLTIQLPEAVTAAIRQQQIVTCRNEIQQLEERLSGLREQLQSLEG